MKWRLMLIAVCSFALIGCRPIQRITIKPTYQDCFICHQNRLTEAYNRIGAERARAQSAETSYAAASAEVERLSSLVSRQKSVRLKQKSQASLPARSEVQAQAAPSSGDEFTAYLSFYCSCPRCCGQYSKGAEMEEWRLGTCAAPARYPKGTVIYFEGYGNKTVADRGGAIKGNRFDIYIGNHAECLRLGRQAVKARVVSYP